MSARTEHEKNSRTGGWLSRTAAFFQNGPFGGGTEPDGESTDDALHHVFRWLGAVIVILLLIYYCTHPLLYAVDDRKIFILKSPKTYAVMLLCIALLILTLMPVRLNDKWNRILSWCWFAAAPFAVYFSLLYLNAAKFHINFFALNKIALLFTFIFLFLLETLVLIVTGSIRFSAVTMAVFIAVVGIANRFVISFRGMALSGADLFSIGTAMSVAGGYTYKVDWYIYMEVVLTFAICLVSLKLRGGRVLKPVARLAVLLVWCIVGGSYYYVCCKTDFLEEHDIRSTGFTHQLRYKNYDMIFTTLTTCFYLSVDKPDGYSVSRVEEIAEPYVSGTAGADDTPEEEKSAGFGENEEETTVAQAESKMEESANRTDTQEMSGEQNETADSENATGELDETVNSENTTDKSDKAATSQKTPNLIVLMNESFADYENIGNGLDLSEDNMPFIHSLTENTIKGYAYASIFGGNTPNSEYEFLTGNTMGFLPESSVGFNLFVRGNLPSIASELKSEGYTTLAMHPYRGTNYRRNIVYPQIGFDTFYTRDDFKNQAYIRNYISDQTLAERIVSEFEKNKETGKPFFSWNVTVQNHGDYFAKNTKNLDMSINVENPEVDQTRTKIYVNLIRQSDAMFEYLVDTFSKEEEPVVIVMFGDHQANLGEDTYEYLLGKKDEDLTPEERMEKYKIPFVIWANYDIQEETVEKTSLNYLYSILADRLGFPMTGYQKYLLDLSEEIPVLCAQGYWTADGSFYELKDQDSPYYDKINEYNILEYNDILGGSSRDLEFLADVQSAG